MNPIEQTSTTTVWTILLLIRLCIGWCYSYLPGSKHSQLRNIPSDPSTTKRRACPIIEAVKCTTATRCDVVSTAALAKRDSRPFPLTFSTPASLWIACGPPTSTRHIASARYSKSRGMPTLCLAMKLHVVLTRYPVAFQRCHRHPGGTCPE